MGGTLVCGSTGGSRLRISVPASGFATLKK